MKTYRVKWIIDLDAESPIDAVMKAREIQMDPESIATVFNVSEIYIPITPGKQGFAHSEETIDLGENG